MKSRSDEAVESNRYYKCRAEALDGAEKRSVRTAPYGRGSVCRCKRLVSILSPRPQAVFSIFQHRLKPVPPWQGIFSRLPVSGIAFSSLGITYACRLRARRRQKFGQTDAAKQFG